MKKPNFGWFFFTFEIYQKISKITNFQNSLEKLCHVLWCCKTMHSKVFVPLLDGKMEKKTFHRFQPIKSAHDWGTIWRVWGSYEPIWAPKPPYCTTIMSGVDGLKTVKCLFFRFAIEQWKKNFRMHCFTEPEDTMRIL